MDITFKLGVGLHHNVPSARRSKFWVSSFSNEAAYAANRCLPL